MLYSPHMYLWRRRSFGRTDAEQPRLLVTDPAASPPRLLPALRVSLMPTPVVVVSSSDYAGNVGAAAIAWTGVVSSRPAVISVSFLPDSFTRKCIMESREFVVNVPQASLVRETNFLGSLSGEWSLKMEAMNVSLASGLTLGISQSIKPPYIREYYLRLECRCLSVHQVGQYDCFFGEVVAMHCDEAAYVANHPRGNIDHGVVSPLMCFGDEYWAGGQMLGRSTENKNHPQFLPGQAWHRGSTRDE
jgi:flavin reductase (DIM6/NTAB) family NADH-FMN oxidoreductase RutF